MKVHPVQILDSVSAVL